MHEGEYGSVELIRTIEEAVAGYSGEAFFKQLMPALAGALGTCCGFVTQFNDSSTTAAPLAYWFKNSQRIMAKSYPLAGTPCESVLFGEMVAFQDSVTSLFPDDRPFLESIGAESYLAIPLNNRAGKIMGHLALIDDAPRDWSETDVNLLWLFAARATTELERMKFEAELHEANRQLEFRIEERTRELASANDQLLREIDRERELTQQLGASEAGFRSLFEESPISIWELDMSGVKTLLTRLRADGVNDFEDYFLDHPDAASRLTGEMRVRRVNRATLELFRVADPHVLLESIEPVMVPGQHGPMFAAIMAAERGENTGSMEMVHRTLDGEIRNTMVSWNMAPGNDLHWSRTMISVVDVTERKRATEELAAAHGALEQRVAERTAALSTVNTRLRHEIASRLRAEAALAKSEQEYRDLYENAPNVYWTIGLDGRVKRANQRASQLFGYLPDALVGMRLIDLTVNSEADHQQVERALERSLSGEAVEGEELAFVAQDGHAIWASVSMAPVFDAHGAVTMVRSTATDITARIAAERNLEQRLNLERLVSEVSYALAEASADNVDEVFARQVTRLAEVGGWTWVRLWQGEEAPGEEGPGEEGQGVEGQGADGQGVDKLRLLSECSIDDEAPPLTKPLIDPVAHLVSLERSAGDSMPLDGLQTYTLLPLQHAGVRLGCIEFAANHPNVTGAYAGLLTLAADRMAGTLIRCRSERELREARRMAEEANRAKSEFLASMSHELRTPLNVILGYTQVLLRDAQANGRKRTTLTTMQNAGEHLLTLIDDVLQLARVEAGKLDLEPRRVGLRGLIDDLTRMFRIRAMDAGLTFEVNIDGNLPHRIVVDDRRLRQVLINLLGNATKFSSPGGRVTLHAGGEHKGDGRWQLSFAVEDQGIGIDGRDLTRIFEPFAQVRESLSQAIPNEGTGLGLSISQRILRAMGGTIEVDSEPGRGSTFRVVIDVEAAQSGRRHLREPQTMINGYQGERRTVLCVDDQSANREMLVRFLHPLGFVVSEAGDGAQAVREVERQSFDLVIVDLFMTGLNGFEAIRRMRAMPDREQMKILAVSASVMERDRNECLAAGSNAMLVKPLQLERLLSTLGELLELAWTFDEVQAKPARRANKTPAHALSQLRDGASAGDVLAVEHAMQTLETSGTDPALMERLRALAISYDMRGLCNEIDLQAGNEQSGATP